MNDELKINDESNTVSPFWVNKDYIGPSRYYTGRIIEYDIKAANVNVLYHEGVLSKERYNYLLGLPKMYREIAVGQMQQQDPKIYDTLINGILKFRQQLIKSNNIKEDEIVRVATDAIYVNRYDDLKYTKFDNVEFVKKSESNNMVKLLDLLIFSRYVDNNIDIDVKGLGDKCVELHKDFMLSLIANVIYLFERVSLESAISYLSGMYEEYVNLQLHEGFYRQLNTTSGYLIKAYNMIVYDVRPTELSNVDINYNITYLRELHNILFENFH